MPSPSSPSPSSEKDRRVSSKSSSLSDRLPFRPRSSINKKDQDKNPFKDENDIFVSSPTSNDGVLTTKFTSDSNNRISDSGQTNDVRLSSRRDTLPSSPGEITQF